MNWDKLNNRLRNDAEQQNGEVDIDSIWSAIEPQVDELNSEKKKKRRAFFFWWGSGVLLLSIGIWFLGNQFSEKGNLTENADNQSVPTEQIKETNNNGSDINATITSTQNEDFRKNDLENKSDLQKENSSKSNFSKNKNKTNSNTNSTQKIGSNTNSRNINAIADLPLVVTAENDNELFRSPHAEKNPSIQKEEVSILKISSFSNLLDSSFEKFSLPDSMAVWFPTLIIERKNKEENDALFSIGVYGGANVTKRTLTAKNEDVSILLDYRKAYETPLETSQAGFQFSYKIPKSNFEITTGLQITSIAERYKFYENTVLTKDIDGVEFLSVGLGQDTVEIYGILIQTRTIEINKKIFNSYRMIDIPVLISYKRSLGEKWKGGIQAGIFTNLSLKVEGIIAGYELEDLELPVEDGAFFKSKVGLSYHLGLSVQRKIAKNWELSFAPSVRYFGNDFSGVNNNISQKYILFGGNVGVSYRF